MIRHDLIEGRIERGRLLVLAGLAQESGIGIDKAQRVFVAVIGRLESLRRLIIVARHGGDQSLVITAEDAEILVVEPVDKFPVPGASDPSPDRAQALSRVAVRSPPCRRHGRIDRARPHIDVPSGRARRCARWAKPFRAQSQQLIGQD